MATKLTAQQAADLVYLQEEEKVARDVYEAMNKLYPNQAFANIMGSEQNHMDSVWNKVVTYGLTAQVADLNTRGVFKNATLQTEYNNLIAKGKLSLRDALEVGVHIEEMDITDIINFMSKTTTDIARVMNNLLDGSYNHLDSFNAALANLK